MLNGWYKYILTMVKNATGFSISGGTTSKTLTVDEDVTMSAKANLVSPVFTTPNIGVATATSINKVQIPAVANAATIAMTDGTILTVEATSVLNQDLTTDASPTHAGMTLTGLTASLPVFTGASKEATSKSIADSLTAFGIPGILGSTVENSSTSSACDINLGTPTDGDLALVNVYSSIMADSGMAQAFSEFKQQSGTGVIEFLNGLTTAYDTMQCSTTQALGVTMYLVQCTTTGAVTLRNTLYQTSAVNPVYVNRIKLYWLKKA